MENRFLKELVKLVAKEVVDELQSRRNNGSGKEQYQSVRLLNTKEAAEHYGVCIGTIRSWISKNFIEGKRVGSRLFVIVKPEIIENDDLPF